jgi:hypothetical protein
LRICKRRWRRVVIRATARSDRWIAPVLKGVCDRGREDRREYYGDVTIGAIGLRLQLQRKGVRKLFLKV